MAGEKGWIIEKPLESRIFNNNQWMEVFENYNKQKINGKKLEFLLFINEKNDVDGHGKKVY